MSSQWPTRRHDIKIARLFIKKHKPEALEDLDHTNMTPEEKLKALYPWVGPLIRRFRQDHPNRDWLVNMLRAIDAIVRPHFKSQKQASDISQGIVACIRVHIAQNNLDDTYNKPTQETQHAKTQLDAELDAELA